jgi:hypothetical protein
VCHSWGIPHALAKCYNGAEVAQSYRKSKPIAPPELIAFLPDAFVCSTATTSPPELIFPSATGSIDAGFATLRAAVSKTYAYQSNNVEPLKKWTEPTPTRRSAEAGQMCRTNQQGCFRGMETPFPSRCGSFGICADKTRLFTDNQRVKLACCSVFLPMSSELAINQRDEVVVF